MKHFHNYKYSISNIFYYTFHLSALAPINTLKGFNTSIFANMILMVVVSGIASTIPHGPQTNPQNTSDTRISKTLRLSDEAIIFGCTTLPIIINISDRRISNKRGIVRLSNCNRERINGSPTEKTEPKVGTKLNKKAIMPQNKGKSTPSIHNTRNVNNPVIPLRTTLTIK